MSKKRGMTPKQAEEVRLKRGIDQGTKLRVLRVEKGLSQNELARESGVSIKSIQRFEQLPNTIDVTNLNTLCSLCETLDCEIPDILEDESLIERFNKVK